MLVKYVYNENCRFIQLLSSRVEKILHFSNVKAVFFWKEGNQQHSQTSTWTDGMIFVK